MTDQITKNSTITRLYWLGDFRNISFSDTVEGIPEELILDNEFVMGLKFSQLLEIELAYRKYLALVKDHPADMSQKSVEAIEDLRTQTIRSLKDYLTNEVTEA